MGRFIEIGPGRKRLDSSLPDDPAEAEAGRQRIADMAAAKQGPASNVWNPSWSRMSLGYDVSSRAKWEAEKKKRGLVDFSPNEAFLTKGQDLRANTHEVYRKCAQKALRDVKQGYVPPPLPSRPEPIPEPPVRNLADELPLEEVMALARDKSIDSNRDDPGYVSERELLGDMYKRLGMTPPQGIG